MRKQGKGIILEKNIEDDVRMKENILLKRDGFFTSYEFNIKDLNLIDKADILPNIVEQSLGTFVLKIRFIVIQQGSSAIIILPLLFRWSTPGSPRRHLCRAFGDDMLNCLSARCSDKK